VSASPSSSATLTRAELPRSFRAFAAISRSDIRLDMLETSPKLNTQPRLAVPELVLAQQFRGPVVLLAHPLDTSHSRLSSPYLRSILCSPCTRRCLGIVLRAIEPDGVTAYRLNQHQIWSCSTKPKKETGKHGYVRHKGRVLLQRSAVNQRPVRPSFHR